MSNEQDNDGQPNSGTPSTPTEPVTTQGDPKTSSTEPTPEGGDPKPAAEKKEESLLEGEEKGAEPQFGLDPVDLEFTKGFVPEGYEANEEKLTAFVEMVNAADSRQALTEGAMKMLADYQTEQSQALVDQWNTQQDSWQQEVRAHKDFGGDKLETTLASVNSVIDNYAPDPGALREVLKVSGAGNNVQLIGMLAKISEAIPGESKPVEGSPAPTQKSRAEKLFSST